MAPALVHRAGRPVKTPVPTNTQKLLNWGYTASEAVSLFDAKQPVVTADGLEG